MKSVHEGDEEGCSEMAKEKEEKGEKMTREMGVAGELEGSLGTRKR